MAATSGPRITFADVSVKEFLQNIVTQINNNPKTVDALRVIAPPSMVPTLILKYQQLLITNPDYTWSQIAKEISSNLILIAAQYVPPTNGIYYITRPSLEAAFHHLWSSSSPLPQAETTNKMSGKTFYLFLNAGLDSSILRTAFIKQGFQEFVPPSTDISIKDGPPLGVMILGGDPSRQTPYIIRRLQQYPCVVKNFLDDGRKVISDKWRLYQNMMLVQSTYPELNLAGSMPQTQELRPETQLEDGKVYIIRPIGRGMCGGKGVVAVSSIQDAIRVYQDHKLCPEIQTSIITDYFPQPPNFPLLYQGRKMHLRMFFLVRPASDVAPFYSELWHRGRIVIAKDPYRPEDWENPDIHDTHSQSTPHNLWFPEDLPDPSQRYLIYERMNNIATGLRIIIEPYVHTYPESKYGFHVFGLDLLVDQNYNVILMEANDKTGLYTIGEPIHYTDNEVSKSFYVDGKYTFQDFTQDYFDWTYVHGIQPFYGGSIPSLKLFGF
jgi:hypothetical protein